MEEDRAVVARHLEELALPLQTMVTEKIAEVKKQQEELGVKMQGLARDLEKVESVLPPSELDELIDKITAYCERVDGCRKRVAAVSKRADTMLVKLNRNRAQPKAGTLIDLT